MSWLQTVERTDKPVSLNPVIVDSPQFCSLPDGAD